MKSSRTVLTLVLVAVVSLAGCTGTLVSASASPATIPAESYESAGYIHGNTSAIPLDYPVGAVGVTRNVTVTSYLSGYSKTTDDNRTAALLVLSTPNARVAGQSVNPFAQLSNRALVERVLGAADSLRAFGNVDDVSDLRAVETHEVDILGTPTDVTTYVGSVTANGTTESVFVHVATVEHGDDVVVAIGVHDETMDEGASMRELMGHIEHEQSAE